VIEAISLSFGYRPGEAVIRTWSGSIALGEVVSLTGRSGSGKSTLLYLLGALLRPWSGSLRIGGVEVATAGDRGRSDVRAAHVGFVFQDALLDTRRSIMENILEGVVYRGGHRGEAVNEARRLLERFAVGVEPNRRATDLSGGQAQRVALCRALIGRPIVLLADEPTGNLDRESAAGVERALFDYSRSGAAVVVATHDEALAARCDRRFPL
jgi:putative ABC transport system ATP-binding protein